MYLLLLDFLMQKSIISVRGLQSCFIVLCAKTRDKNTLVNCILNKSPTVISDVYAQISLAAGLIKLYMK